MAVNSLSEPATRMNHVFVDGENVHQIDPAVTAEKPVSFTLLLGAKQTKLNPEILEKLMARAAAVQLIRLSSTGKNALDFALAYYVGRAAVADPTGYFHVISRDKGFDPLIEHLSSRNIQAKRHDDFSTLMLSSPSPKPSAPAAGPILPRVLELLRRDAISRPKKRKTLVNRLRSSAGLNVSEADINEAIDNLVTVGVLVIGDTGGVTYHL